MKISAIKFSIRFKLLLISTALLLVPWIGVHYIQDMEYYLRANQQQSLLGRAQVVAAVLQGQTDLFNTSVFKNPDAVENKSGLAHLYVRPIKRAMQLDGYIDDWLDFEEKSKRIESKNPQVFEYRYLLASYKKYLYMVIKVKDRQVVYRKANSLSLNKNDYVIIKMKNKEGELKNYFIATQSPGWVNAHRMEKYGNEWISVAPELRIKGEWQENLEGYTLEVRVPLALIGDEFSFFVANVNDDYGRETISIIGESKIDDALGSIIIPSIKIEKMLTRINRPASRTWVIDQRFRVLAVAGDISSEKTSAINNESDTYENIISIFYHLLLKQPTHDFKDDLSTASYLRGEAVQRALAGKPATQWRDTPDNQVRILTASYPVIINGETLGAIAIEETSNSILILQNRAMEILINLSALTFLITVFILLTYATRLSLRIRRLRDEAEHAISTDGRIESVFSVNRSTDEIGDLSRSFADMLSCLAEYNRYLETMAGKLSHELRTPITVVRSSLENLKLAKTEDVKETYIQRASDGMERLSDILTRMSEATRLEQTLQSETRQPVYLCSLIESCVAGYEMGYPNVQIEFENSLKTDCEITGVPELLAQMLDKLVSNAVDFHSESTPVIIRISEHKKQIQLSVINQGSALPDAMRDNLFESMVSVRHKKGDQPHLGLGLYIVKLIVEFHGGRVRADNLDDGVEVVLHFPFG